MSNEIEKSEVTGEAKPMEEPKWLGPDDLIPNGGEVKISDYPDLYEALKGKYPSDEERGTFTLPNLTENGINKYRIATTGVMAGMIFNHNE